MHPTRVVPERDADPTRGLVPPTRRTPEVDEGKELAAHRKAGAGNVFQGPLIQSAVRESVRKLDPRRVARNPVMFVVEIGAAITTLLLPFALMSLFIGLLQPYNAFLASHGRGAEIRNIVVSIGVASLAALVVFVPRFGIAGAAWSGAAVMALDYLLHLYYYSKFRRTLE